MAALMLRDLPATLYRLLKQEAKRHNRSMNKQAISLLEQALMPVPRLSAKDLPKPLNTKRPFDSDFIIKAIGRSRP